MPLPQPKVPLTDVCSVIFNNTLYTYSAGAFQSLPLKSGAQWSQLPAGESVTGGVCVGATPADASQAGFWVVGGKGKTDGYSGLQKFTYSTGKWETITPGTLVTQDRLWHGAVFLNNSNAILLYAGAQDGAQHPSSQTFTIQAAAPFGVLAYQSVAPPTINPILLPWSDTQAVLIGGSESNNKVMIFGADSGWIDSGASLASPLSKNITALKAAIVTGDDGCKNLYTFDMTQSPNEVNRTVLINGQGQPQQSSIAITARSADKSGSTRRSRTERRQLKTLTLDDWPEYNSTLAPKAMRSNYAVAEDQKGLVVISGGNQDDVLCMFDGRRNGWLNATDQLVAQKAITSGPPASAPPASSSSPEPSSTSTLTPASAGSTESSSPQLGANTILGIVLGSIAGAALILVIIYILIRWRRKQQDFFEAGHNRRSSGIASPEKGGFAFANDSLPQGPTKGTFRGHQQQDSANSFSSMAILMGRVNQQKQQQPPMLQQPGVSRNNSKETKRGSAGSVFNKAFKNTISKPLPYGSSEQDLTAPSRPETREDRGVSFGRNVAEPRPRASNAVDRQGSTRRSSGWNRYWSGGSTLNILGFGGGKGDAKRRETVDSDQSSRYSNDQRDHRITQDSATVPPLNVPEHPRPKFQRVNSGSPTMSNYDNRIKDEMRAQIERPSSRVSNLSGYSSGIPASVHDAWDPTSAAASKPWGADRAPTNAYNGSSFTKGHTPSSSGSKVAPTGVSQQPQLAMAATSSDMSWLNLGDFAKYQPPRR